MKPGNHAKRLPVSDHAKRIAGIFHRRLATPWSAKEVKVFRSIVPLDEDELAMLERYYSRNWPPRDGNVLRHDMSTFLNNYNGEVDRARIWCAKYPVKNKIIKFPVEHKAETSQEWTAEEAEIAATQRQGLADLKRKLRG